MGLRVIQPGLFTTVQDRGRPGYRSWGVPEGGAFDRDAAEMANALLGQDGRCATLEMTLLGGHFEAQVPLAIALAGAPMDAAIVGPDGSRRPLALPLCCTLGISERLIVSGTSSGARTYLAVAGGWQTPAILGSRSSETPIAAGTVLPAAPSTTPTRHLGDDGGGSWSDPTAEPFRVLTGPDAPEPPLLAEWLASTFRADPRCDRVGLRLGGPPLDVASPPDRLSAPVAPGAVQVAGGGIHVLGVAGGTMGGYPHVAHVISADISRLGQVRPGDQLRFQLVSREEARTADRRQRSRKSERLRLLAALAGGLDRLETRD
jgi:allophanate hydrolase subunit 2